MTVNIERQLFNDLVRDRATLPGFLSHFEKEAGLAQDELVMKGQIEKLSSKLPVIMEVRFRQLQYLNAAMQLFENFLSERRSYWFKKFKENYPRDLSSSDVVKYVDGEKDITDLLSILLEIGSLRAEFEAINKALNSKSYQINNITNLRVAGLDDATIG